MMVQLRLTPSTSRHDGIRRWRTGCIFLVAVGAIVDGPRAATGFASPSAIFLVDCSFKSAFQAARDHQGIPTTRGHGIPWTTRIDHISRRKTRRRFFVRRPSLDDYGEGAYGRTRGRGLDGDEDDDNDDDGKEEEEEEDYDDMGLGVTSTVARKKGPRIEDFTEEPPNAIFEIADAAQEIADSMLPPDEFDKYKRKPDSKASSAKARGGDGAGDPMEGGDKIEEDDGDLGMGISATVTPATEPDELVVADNPSFSRGLDAILGADELEELERMSTRDAKRAQMEMRGLSKEQIAAYLGEDLSVSPELEKAQKDDDQMVMFQDAAFEDTRTMQEADEMLGVVTSSSLVTLDESGQPLQDRFVYVDEYTCIGCTHCSHAAPSTFFMEPEFGRARVFQQESDTDMAIREAIQTCPVDCIHYVGWNELKRLEAEREGIDINFKARLVGNDHDNIKNGQQLISGNQGMRCENCPSKGCYNCPMYGVGFNPEYVKRKAENKAKRQARLRKEQEEISGPRSADL